jgi:hypothetical protein
VTGSDTDPSSSRKPARGGLRFKLAATAAAVALAGLSAARVASASFDEAPLPIGDVASMDGIISGTVHLAGGRLIIYSGDRFQTNQSSLAVNFASGGSLLLCPHSHLQILSANEHAGVMLAFQEGGSQHPFMVHANDVVMTPDWRIQMTGSVPSGDFGTLQLSTTRRGDLCLSSNAKAGQFFRISELAGDSVYEIPGQSNIRIADGRIDNAPGGCSCEGAVTDGISPPAQEADAQPPAIAILTPSAPTAVATTPLAGETPLSSPAAAPQPQNAPGKEPVPLHIKHQRQRPQDAAGYVRSFLHLFFGR